MQIKFVTHRRVFMAIAVRKYHKNSYRATLFVTLKEKGRKTWQNQSHFCRFSFGRAENCYCTL